jgi:hypothetical protein
MFRDPFVPASGQEIYSVHPEYEMISAAPSTGSDRNMIGPDSHKRNGEIGSKHRVPRHLPVAATAGVLLITSLLATRASAAFHVHSLVGESNEAIAAYAVAYAQANTKVIGASPQVLLVRSILPSDPPKLGLGGPLPYPVGDPPLTLVVLHGEFDISGLAPGWYPAAGRSTVAYVAYVFDDKARAPTEIDASPRGGGFRTLLNDPNLPADTPLVTPDPNAPTAVAAPPRPQSSVRAPYGSVAPTVEPRP